MGETRKILYKLTNSIHLAEWGSNLIPFYDRAEAAINKLIANKENEWSKINNIQNLDFNKRDNGYLQFIKELEFKADSLRKQNLDLAERLTKVSEENEALKDKTEYLADVCTEEKSKNENLSKQIIEKEAEIKDLRYFLKNYELIRRRR